MSNPVVHFEIGCRDMGSTAEFYSKLFDWKLQPMGPATMIDTGAGGIAGHITSLGHEPHNFTHFYVQVDDLQAALDKAGALGGKTVVPPVTIPTGSFAWFADPDGNTVGLFKPNSK
jgi:predicted enzyme related to lactoylglutathione lyase